MTDYNGAYQTYADKTSSKVFFRAEDTHTETVTIVSGQVLKKRTFLETNAAGKAIAHSGIIEKAVVTFPTKVDTGETVIIAGLTFTAGSNSTTLKAELAAAWAGLPDGTTAAQANIINASRVSAAIGTFTAGTLTGYKTKVNSTAGTVLFVSTTSGNVTDLTVTGTGDASSVAVTAVSGNKVCGILLFDVDASGGDVDATAYTEASFWADALVWSVNPAVDTITLADGTTKACTEYDTGCGGTTAAAILLQKKFVEGTEFESLGFLKAGEIM